MDRALGVLSGLLADGVVQDYAIGGAMGATFYLEAVLTVDLDVFVLFRDEKSLAPLEPIYAALRERGYAPDEIHRECVLIEGTPVQFLPVYNALLEEALGQAKSFDYCGAAAKVLSAEYLVAIAVQTGRPKDWLRVLAFLEAEILDEPLLNKILVRHGLQERYDEWRKM